MIAHKEQAGVRWSSESVSRDELGKVLYDRPLLLKEGVEPIGYDQVLLHDVNQSLSCLAH